MHQIIILLLLLEQNGANDTPPKETTLQGVFCDVVSPGNVIRCIHKAHQHDCQNVKWTRSIRIHMPNQLRKIPQDCNAAKNYRKLNKGGTRRWGPSQGRLQQLVFQYHTVNHENIQIVNIKYSRYYI